MKIILASKSGVRKQILDKYKIDSEVQVSNVDEDQVEDRVDEALQYYREYHSDATVRTYLKHQVTATDISNEYISLSNNILFVSTKSSL